MCREIRPPILIPSPHKKRAPAPEAPGEADRMHASPCTCLGTESTTGMTRAGHRKGLKALPNRTLQRNFM